jgi:uncharacterized phosphosugar-binding protein
MSADVFLTRTAELIQKIQTTQMDNIKAAAKVMAESIASGNAVHAFGSGHSVIPVMDLFPRYGSYVGYHPIMDARLMWTNVIGSGGAPEVIWQERQEGYIDVMLNAHKLNPGDTMLIYSHGGMNAAPVEMALAAKEKGLPVIGVTCVDNRKINDPTHSSGKSLHDIADIVVDNCSPPEDAVVSIEGVLGNVGATSTVTAVTVTMCLLSETSAELAARGKMPKHVFVSPNVPGVAKDNNDLVYKDYVDFVRNRQVD